MPRAPHRVNQFLIGPPAVLRYPKLSLLGLPGELRDNIWACIFADISEGRRIHSGKSTTKAKRRFAVLLTCRQIYHEASNMAYRHVTFSNTALFSTLVKSPQFPRLACLGCIKRFHLWPDDLPYLRSTLEECHFPLERLELQFDVLNAYYLNGLEDDVRKFIVNTPTIKTLLLLEAGCFSCARMFLETLHHVWKNKPEYGAWITDGAYLTKKPSQISVSAMTRSKTNEPLGFEATVTSSGVERTVLVHLEFTKETEK